MQAVDAIVRSAEIAADLRAGLSDAGHAGGQQGAADVGQPFQRAGQRGGLQVGPQRPQRGGDGGDRQRLDPEGAEQRRGAQTGLWLDQQAPTPVRGFDDPAAVHSAVQPAQFAGGGDFGLFVQTRRLTARDGGGHFGQRRCPYCKMLLQNNFGLTDIETYARRHFDVVPIDIASSQAATPGNP